MKKSFLLILFPFLLFFSCKSMNSTLPEGQNPYGVRDGDNVIIDFPESPNPSNPNPVPVENNEPIEIDVIDYESPEQHLMDVIPEDDGLTDDVRVNNNRLKFTVTPTQEMFNGGAVVNNFVENHIYTVFCQPVKISSIYFEPGEKIVSPPTCGNTEMFTLGNSFTLKDGIRQEVINIKPIAPYKETTLTIYTDRRVYNFELKSYKNTYMPIVSFNYPVSSFEAMQNEAMKMNNAVYLNGDITGFTFDYEIIPMRVHAPSWTPSLVFSDGIKTYIHFPSAEKASYAPVLFSIDNKARQLLNYRVVGNWYIVDHFIDHAELVLDINNNNIVTIKRINS